FYTFPLSALVLSSPYAASFPIKRPSLFLHDALPIWPFFQLEFEKATITYNVNENSKEVVAVWKDGTQKTYENPEEYHLSKLSTRSEEHTSELQSRFDLVCRLLLEQNKRRRRTHLTTP